MKTKKKVFVYVDVVISLKISAKTQEKVFISADVAVLLKILVKKKKKVFVVRDEAPHSRLPVFSEAPGFSLLSL